MRVRSVAYLVERASLTDVVNPTWLLDHDVNRPAGAVPVETRHVQGFGDDPLRNERRVAVQEQRDHALAIAITAPILLRSHSAFDHRVRELQVVWIGTPAKGGSLGRTP